MGSQRRGDEVHWHQPGEWEKRCGPKRPADPRCRFGLTHDERLAYQAEVEEAHSRPALRLIHGGLATTGP